MHTKLSFPILCAAGLGFSVAAAAAATMIRVDFHATGPVAFAPVVGVFHNGSFNHFDAGSMASPSMEVLAEVGNPMPLLATVPGTANGGTNGAPVPVGGMTSFIVTAADGNGMFSYASMLLPTNDWFIGNDTARDVSVLLGASPGMSLAFNVMNVWDAGTELEDFATSAGNPLLGLPDGNAAGGTAQGGVVSLVTAPNPFASFANQPGGFNPAALNFTGNPVGSFTLTVVPEPGTAMLAAVAALPLLRRRRK